VRLTRFVRASFVPLLGVFVVLGFVVPRRALLPTEFMLPALAAMVFVSSFRIAATGLRGIAFARIGVFCAARYVVLPPVLWWISSRIDPVFGLAVLLLTLAPAGTASPGVAAMYGGNVALSITLLVVSSLAAPFLIPAMLQVTIARSIEIDLWGVFRSLLYTILIPIILHVPVRRARRVARWIRENDSLFVVPLIGVLIVTVIGHQRDIVLRDPVGSMLFVVASFVLFALYFVVGWSINRGVAIGDRASYALASGVNNTAMGLVLAYLYFPAEVAVFFVAAELAWVLGMVVFKLFLDRTVGARDAIAAHEAR
jgi:BASS family bile acid:Na+ symporter